jgi:hypothetical protein
MAALIIPSTTPFGGMTNQTTSRLLSLNTTLERLKDAIATASAGYEGTPGTEFEAAPLGNYGPPLVLPNNFGVQANPDALGKNGTDYAYAIGVLTEAWATFWAAAEASIAQLDNGGLL